MSFFINTKEERVASALIFLSEVSVASINTREECMTSVLVSPSEACMALFPSGPGKRAWLLFLLFLLKKTLPVSSSRTGVMCVSVSFSEGDVTSVSVTLPLCVCRK